MVQDTERRALLPRTTSPKPIIVVSQVRVPASIAVPLTMMSVCSPLVLSMNSVRSKVPAELGRKRTSRFADAPGSRFVLGTVPPPAPRIRKGVIVGERAIAPATSPRFVIVIGCAASEPTTTSENAIEVGLASKRAGSTRRPMPASESGISSFSV